MNDQNKTYTLEYLAILANVNHSLRWVDFGDGYRVETINRDNLINLLAELYDLPKHEIEHKIEVHAGYESSKKTIYILRKSFDKPALLYESKKGHNWVDDWSEVHLLISVFQPHVFEIIQLLRLYRPGDLYLYNSIFFTYEEQCGEIRPTLFSSIEDEKSRAGTTFNIPRNLRHSINEFVEHNPIGTLHPNVRLALQSYDLSFEVSNNNLAFLTLMTAQEALLNESHQELKFRVCRATAVLLGTSTQKSRRILSDMKKLYDKRSLLVHTGICKKFSEDDVNLLKEYVRQSIVRVIQLSIPKDKLTVRLSELGFDQGTRLK